MGRRIKTPINEEAFREAKTEFENKYSTKLPLTPGTEDHRKLRGKWLEMYKKHGGELDDGKAFQDAPPYGH
jgi:hypothetical protein